MFYVSVLVDSESGCCTYKHKSSHKENAEEEIDIFSALYEPAFRDILSH